MSQIPPYLYHDFPSFFPKIIIIIIHFKCQFSFIDIYLSEKLFFFLIETIMYYFNLLRKNSITLIYKLKIHI